MNSQQVSSVIRQVLAVAAVVLGALTQVLSGIHLPTAMSAVLAAGGVLLLNVEHYLSDPSTGTPVTQTAPVAAPIEAPPDPVVQTPPVVVAPPPTA